ncbi:MAG TPA: glycoside hydrolase family 2 TIM barrel-domain containing protein [Chloroflexota bacterium]|nr:glycoside hydrolase family 2 TIM barrel-domain containing protein [Chloroflexota bacterium]
MPLTDAPGGRPVGSVCLRWGLAAGVLAGLVGLTALLALRGSAMPSGSSEPCSAPSPGAVGATAPATSPPVPTPTDNYTTPTPTAVLGRAEPVPVASGPAMVEVRGEPYRYAYYVNGVREVLRGIGYNVAYRAWGWDCEARARRYDRDFALMRAAGFNTLIGWDEGEFDDLTLAKAQQHGLGVVLPYDFPRDADWEDPAQRAVHRQRIETLVRRYAGHPALRMWGLGNEVVLAIGDPASPRARAFAQFLAEVAERVHQLDPNHPVIYRDGEDVYYEPIRDALRARGLEQPWFVYGITAFTFRLQEILDGWPAADFRVPLLVSEFGLVNYPLPQRAAGLVRMWDIIRQHDAYVLGGAVYAWTTEGIETTDVQFGLVDGQGHPIDGALEALRARLTSP